MTHDDTLDPIREDMTSEHESLFDTALRDARAALLKLNEACLGDPGIPDAARTAYLPLAGGALDDLEGEYGS